MFRKTVKKLNGNSSKTIILPVCYHLKNDLLLFFWMVKNYHVMESIWTHFRNLATSIFSYDKSCYYDIGFATTPCAASVFQNVSYFGWNVSRHVLIVPARPIFWQNRCKFIQNVQSESCQKNTVTRNILKRYDNRCLAPIETVFASNGTIREPLYCCDTWEKRLVLLGFVIMNRIYKLYLGQPIFLTKNVKFWLYNLQILTLFWPIHFLHLQLNENAEYKAYISNQSDRLKTFFLLKSNKTQKCERPNETRGNKP